MRQPATASQREFLDKTLELRQVFMALSFPKQIPDAGLSAGLSLVLPRPGETDRCAMVRPPPSSMTYTLLPRLDRRGLSAVAIAHVLLLSGLMLLRPSQAPVPETLLTASLILPEAPIQAEPSPPIMEPAKPASVRPSPVDPEPAKPEPIKPAPAKVEMPRPEPVPAVPEAAPVPVVPVTPKAEPIAPRSEPRLEAPPPAPQAPAPAVPPAARATPAALPGNKDDVRKYIAALMRQLNRHKTYPAALKKAKIEGRVVLQFSLDKSGRLMASSVKQGSGSPELDRAALEMLARANPLPAIPDFMERDELALAIPVEYSLITDR
jgi:protein TonB